MKGKLFAKQLRHFTAQPEGRSAVAASKPFQDGLTAVVLMQTTRPAGKEGSPEAVRRRIL